MFPHSAVPGELRGLELLHQRHATIAWSKLIVPSTKLAREGFKIRQDLANRLTMNREFLYKDPSWAEDFAPDGSLKGFGDVLTRKRYANTLEKIAKEGASTFYNGEIAAATIQAIKAANGTMTIDDLSSYRSYLREPVQIKYRDFILISNALPAGGPQAFSMMKTIEGYPSMGKLEALNLSTHYLVEAMRFSFGEVCMLQRILWQIGLLIC